MVTDLLDQTLGFQVEEGFASAGTVNLQTINQDGSGDELVGWDLLEHLGVSLLVHDGGVVDFLLSLSFRPLLLLTLGDVDSLKDIKYFSIGMGWNDMEEDRWMKDIRK